MTGKEKINLLVLIVSMPAGGVENQVLSVVRRLDRGRFEPVICCIRERGALGEMAAKEGLNVIALNLMKSSRFSLAIPLRIAEVLKEHRIHVLWTHQYVANLYGRMAALVAKTPAVIATFRALYDRPKRHRSLFNHLLAYRTDRLVAVSGAVAQDITAHDRVHANKITVIRNGIDLSLFNVPLSKRECRKMLGLPEEGIIVGATGRLSKEKNHMLLIEAVKRLPQDVKGVLVGDGPLRKDLERAGAGKFYFLGQLEYNLIPVSLKALDIYCFPSLWEGMPSALAEAMAAGLPVIASDISSHRELLGDAGMYVPSGDTDALTGALKRLIDDPPAGDSLGRKAKERAQMFSIENTVRAYEGLFEGIIRGKNLYGIL
ncbi:MAG: glycosyltransferase [Nitrospiraceae bacterium]|nr:MAG: glycosyltransferase [Nitrospiraceae bacterium]